VKIHPTPHRKFESSLLPNRIRVGPTAIRSMVQHFATQ
jgi:hypothetical protein